MNINGAVEKGTTCSFMTATTNASSFSLFSLFFFFFFPEPLDSARLCGQRLFSSWRVAGVSVRKNCFLHTHVDWGKLGLCATPTRPVGVACCCFVSRAAQKRSSDFRCSRFSRGSFTLLPPRGPEEPLIGLVQHFHFEKRLHDDSGMDGNYYFTIIEKIPME